MQIIDSIKYIDNCFENGKFSKNRWDLYIEKVCSAAKLLIESDAAGYDFAHDILPVLNAVYDNNDKIQELHHSFITVTHDIEEKIKYNLHTDLDADIILYLGLCNGAGWATKINGRSTVLLGIEKIIELDWADEVSMIGLIYHELGHLWHFQERTFQTDIDTAEAGALWQLYSEGVAMYCEQLLCGDDHFFHQDKNGWLMWCAENKKRLFSEYIFRIEKGESVQCFFGDWNSFEGHSDIGYFLGAELVRKALQKYPLSKVLNLSLDEIKQLLYLCIENVD